MAYQAFDAYRNLRERPIHTPSSTTEAPVTYLSTYWKNNPGKPPLTIGTGTAAELMHRLTLMRNQNHWNDWVITTFMARVIQENPQVFQATLTEAWNFDNRVIGAAQEEVTPLSVYDLREDPEIFPPLIPAQNIGESNEARLSTFFSLLMLYRKTIARASDLYYGMELAGKLNDFFKSRKTLVSQDHINDWTGYVGNDYMTSGYKRIICCIDMFYQKFHAHDYSLIRMATVPSRFRGCIALTAVNQIAKMAGIPPRELLCYIFTEPVMKDVSQIYLPGQGMEHQDGYFPYQLEMELISKSPYSLSANPTLCLWLHIIGAVNGYQRSLKARMPNALDKAGTYISAAAVGLNIAGTGDSRREISFTQEGADHYRKQLQLVERPEQGDVIAPPPERQEAERAHEGPGISKFMEPMNFRRKIVLSQEEADHYRKQLQLAERRDVIAPSPEGQEAEGALHEPFLLPDFPEIPSEENQDEEAAVEDPPPASNPDTRFATNQRVNRVLTELINNDGLSRTQLEALRAKANRYKNAMPGSVGEFFYMTATGIQKNSTKSRLLCVRTF